MLVLMSSLLTLSKFSKLIFWFLFPINPIRENELTGFYMMETFFVDGLKDV